jgi:hypothetical protein
LGRLGDRFLAEARRGGRRNEGARAPPRERDELRDLLGALRRVLVATYFPSDCSGGQRVTKVTPVNTSNRIWARAPPGGENRAPNGKHGWVGTLERPPGLIRAFFGAKTSLSGVESPRTLTRAGRKPGIGIVRRKTLASRHSIATGSLFWPKRGPPNRPSDEIPLRCRLLGFVFPRAAAPSPPPDNLRPRVPGLTLVPRWNGARPGAQISMMTGRIIGRRRRECHTNSPRARRQVFLSICQSVTCSPSSRSSASWTRSAASSSHSRDSSM